MKDYIFTIEFYRKRGATLSERVISSISYEIKDAKTYDLALIRAIALGKDIFKIDHEDKQFGLRTKLTGVVES